MASKSTSSTSHCGSIFVGVGLCCLLSGCGQGNNASETTQNAVFNSAPPVVMRKLEEVKNYKYPAGTVLAARAAQGKYSLVKVLRVERLKTNDAHNNAIVIHFRTYEELFPSLKAAKAAATANLKPRVEHGVAGKEFLESNVQQVARVPVRDNELGGYRKWQQKYESGQAAVFPIQ